jgi:CRP-like cAMP-binding protein
MPCKAEDLRPIPLFALLDDDEMAILAAQVEIKKFAARQRIYKIGEPGKHAYVMMSGVVRVTTVDQDHQEVLAIQAPVIMMSQNRQDTKDRVRGELDYDVNVRAESEIQALSNKLNLLSDKIGDFDDLLREQLRASK